MIVISIPLIRIDQTYEVYKALSVPILPPVPIRSNDRKNSDVIATNNLEATGFLIDKLRTRYQLLTDTEVTACSHTDVKFCTVQGPVFPVSLGQTCIINLFRSTSNTPEYCMKQISNVKLPIAIYLFEGQWIIITRTRLTFALVCGIQHSELQTSSLVDIITIDYTCTASNEHFSLTTPYILGKSVIHEDNSLNLTVANFSHVTVWERFKERFINKTVIDLPKHLDEISDMSMNSLLREMGSLLEVNVEFKSSWTVWQIMSLVLATVVVIIRVIGCVLYRCKHKTYTKLCLPKCLYRVLTVKQQEAVTTDVELRVMEDGGTSPPTASAPVHRETQCSDVARETLYPSYFVGPGGMLK